MDRSSPQNGSRPRTCWCGQTFPVLAITAPLSCPSVSQGGQQGCSPAAQLEVGMSLECWQTNKVVQLAKNCPSFMLTKETRPTMLKWNIWAQLCGAFMCAKPTQDGDLMAPSPTQTKPLAGLGILWILYYCFLPSWISVWCHGTWWWVLGGKSWMFWAGQKSSLVPQGTCMEMAGQLSQVQVQVWNTSKWRKKRCFPEHFILWKCFDISTFCPQS